jgi:hypothetical protein
MPFILFRVLVVILIITLLFGYLVLGKDGREDMAVRAFGTIPQYRKGGVT